VALARVCSLLSAILVSSVFDTFDLILFWEKQLKFQGQNAFGDRALPKPLQKGTPDTPKNPLLAGEGGNPSLLLSPSVFSISISTTGFLLFSRCWHGCDLFDESDTTRSKFVLG